MNKQYYTYLITLEEDKAVKHKDYWVFVYKGVVRYNDESTLKFYSPTKIDTSKVRMFFELTKGLDTIIDMGLQYADINM